jgi:DNA-binding beta-propeller fold protein YncE
MGPDVKKGFRGSGGSGFWFRGSVIASVLFAATLAAQQTAAPQSTVAPSNDAPNPFTTVEGWAKMPAGREWGSTSAVDIDRDGRSIWVAERCGKAPDGRVLNRCFNAQTGEWSPHPPVLKFDSNGNLVTSFAAGMIVWPHGIDVDRDGNIWVTDGLDNFPGGGRGAAAAGTPPPAPPAKPVGHQILKFSPDGKLLMALGKAGGNRPGETPDPASFYQPNDVITSAKGEIFVVEGHNNNSQSQRLIKLDRTGKFIKETGKRGSAPGEFLMPHALEFDSKGRLFVADRGNNRIQIYDQELNLLETGWEQYSRISGLWIDPKDMLYAADSESGSVDGTRTAWKRGIRIGNIRDGKNGKILAFIPDPSTVNKGSLAAEGVAVDAAGNIYGAEVGPATLKKYIRK